MAMQPPPQQAAPGQAPPQGAPQGEQQAGGEDPMKIADMVAAGITALTMKMKEAGVPPQTIAKLGKVGDMFMQTIDEAAAGGEPEQPPQGAASMEGGVKGQPMAPGA